MNFETPQIKEFKTKLLDVSREDLLTIIEQQSPEYIQDINRIEWVFRNKLSHLNDSYGNPIVERDLTHDELIRLIDPPFYFSKEMMKQGFNEDAQRQIHIASDPVLWNKQILNVKPRAYQTLALREPNDQVVLRWGRRLGKALDVDTVIPTPLGYKTMAEIEVGDQVFDENGEPCNVTDVTEFQYDRECYKIRFVDSSEIIADADHVWSVNDAFDRNSIAFGHPRPLQNLTTKQMAESVISSRTKEKNYSIPLTAPVNFPEKELRLDSWVYGYLISNGHDNSVSVRVIEKDHEPISKQFSDLGYPLLNEKGNKFTVGSLSSSDFDINQIAPDYLMGSIEQRKRLFQGICDARASVIGDHVEISLPSKEFIEQIHTLATGLGFECRRTEKVNKKNGTYYGTNYKLQWPNDATCFTLERKNIKPDQKRRHGKYRLISDIELVESRPVKCIAVDSRSRLFLASTSHIPTHNSYFLAMYILWYAFVHKRARVLVMAPAKTQVALVYELILELADKSDVVSNSITKKPRSPQHEIWFTNNASIKLFTTGFKSGGKSDGARGQEADMIVLDEMDYMGAEDLVALMAMLQDTDESKLFDKKLIGASTPTGQRSTYWRWCSDPKENFSSFYYPSYVNPLWSQKEEDKAHLRYRNEQNYRHEIEADWGEDADGVYPRKYVDIAFSQNHIGPYEDFRPSPASFIYTLGVDWDKHGAGVNIAIIQAELNNTMGRPLKVVYREEIPKGEYTYIEAVDYIIKIDAEYNFDHIYIDQGAGEVQAEMLHKYGLENPRSRMHVKTKACHFSNVVEVRDPYTRQIVKKRLKPFMVDNLVYQLEQMNLQFNSDDDELYLQLISYIKLRETESGNPVYAPGGETEDHAHDALILSLFALAENYDALFSSGEPQSPRPISNSFFMPDSSSKEKVASRQKELVVNDKDRDLFYKPLPARLRKDRLSTSSKGKIIKRSSF